jgi:hypothetical protein
MPFLVRIVSVLQPVGIAIIAAIPHKTLREMVAIRNQNLQPVVPENSLCISRTTEHFVRHKTRIVRTSEAINDRPDITHSVSVVMELNCDKPWLRA